MGDLPRSAGEPIGEVVARNSPSKAKKWGDDINAIPYLMVKAWGRGHAGSSKGFCKQRKINRFKNTSSRFLVDPFTFAEGLLR